MGLFDFFNKKKDEPSYDPTNLKLSDLNVGFIVEYDMQNWEVKKAFEYDWGNNCFTKEFQLFDGKEYIYLSVDDNTEMELSVTRPVKIRHIEEDLPEYIVSRETPPSKISYEGVTYFLDEDSAGYCKEFGEDEGSWAELINWDFYDKSEEKILSITQWGEKEFEASIGTVVKEFQFSNIIPSNKA
ncbi:DUF4178 domain-containing protein [Aureibacter tunicatorum]|uniref:DUF4178 domain-containing protein n=1 Tax=Aureibacter tunicatorum TaxID=866807 RepID=A0AAE3XKP1_9BACT|nr:DUF4178 domain-containing protein [Aureibacter tunicatorum]MDR6238652.1 hypothetical protein [Aureibacter tunicatorum]BDD05417.1 hypothetical protein AUTU_29000 [Aureibacter tunicatorum]